MLKTYLFIFFTLINLFQFLLTEIEFKLPALLYLNFLTLHSLIHNTIFYVFMSFKSIIYPNKFFKLEKFYLKFNFCISFVVVLCYWINELTRTGLLVPINRNISYTLDLLTHGFNFVMNLITCLILYDNDKENEMNLKYLFSYFTLYLVYICIFFEITGFAPYIIIGYGYTDYRFIILYILGIVSFILGEYLYRLINDFKKEDNLNKIK